MRARIGSVFALTVALFVAAPVMALGQELENLFTPFRAGGAEINATVDAIEDHPAVWAGRVVRVSGEVEGCDRLPQGAFLIEDSDLLGLNENVLVVRPSQEALQRLLPAAGVSSLEPFGGFGPVGPLPGGCAGLLGPAEFGGGGAVGDDEGPLGFPDERVQVTGLVRIFDLAEFEQTFGVDVPDEQFRQFVGRPYIIAFRVDATAL